MNETKWTPGPWIAVDVKTAECLPHRWIANCGADQAVIIQESKRISQRSEAQANARLISKAPEMAEALELLMPLHEEYQAKLEASKTSKNFIAENRLRLESIRALLNSIQNGGDK